jgi:hypothetical protein
MTRRAVIAMTGLVVVGAIVGAIALTVDAPQTNTATDGRTRTVQSDPAPTRLIGRPALFRITGKQPTRFGNVISPRVDYVVIFRLSRDPKRHINSDSYDLPKGALASRGNFTLMDDLTFNPENGIYTLGRSGRGAHCFSAPTPARVRTPKLDKVSVGDTVRFSLQPLTPTAGGSSKLGRTYVTHPRLRTADWRLRRSGARRELKRMGCDKAAQEQFGG